MSDTTGDIHAFGDGSVTASVAAAGAELQSFRHARAGEMLWQAAPVWPRHAPVLFPIVGRLAGDTLRHRGFAGRMTQHGFARDRVFAFEARHAAGCRLVLADDAESRVAYPFAFRLAIDYRVENGALHTHYRVENTGDEVLPVSLGAHPAFRWPLADGIPKEAHRLRFEMDENGPVRQVAGGLLQPDAVPNPVAGRDLALSDALFAADAIILDPVSSRAVRYEAPGVPDAPAITVAWEGFSTLGIWSKPADFVCIEPWSGIASPVGDAGEFSDKPGMLAVAPGGTLERRITMRIDVPG